MAKTVQPIAIELGIKGGEKLAALNRSFRDLSKQVKLSDDDIAQATKDVISFAEGAGRSVATIKALAKAFQGLQDQAKIGGKVYNQLGNDIRSLKAEIDSLEEAAKSTGQAFKAMSIPSKVPEKFAENMRARRQELQGLAADSREYLNALSGIVNFERQQSVREQRAGVSAAARAAQAGLPGSVTDMYLPDTLAGLRQRANELDFEIQNLTIGSDEYIRANRELADVQEQLNFVVNDSTRAFQALDRAQSGAERRAKKLADIQSYYGEKAGAGVSGYRDPMTGAIIAPPAPGSAQVSLVQQPVREISGLYQSIGDVGMQKISADIEMMGNSYQEVAQDIRNATKASNNSIASLNGQRNSWVRLRDQLDPTSKDFRDVTREIERVDKALEKTSRRRRMSPMQMTQAAGAAISGGIFGGPEGFLGGAIGAIGGVGGAFAGAAIGAQVGGLRRQLGEFADYAAQIQKMQIALRGVAGSQDEFNRAMAAASSVTKELNVPQDVAIQGMTRLTAAVKGAGGGVADAELAFKNINSAIIATGGGAEQVEGAVTALVQIFSKGKVSAEEINQIAERLPGTFNKIAAASGRTGPELTKALQDGKVGLNDLMKFLVQLGDDYGKLAEKIAASSESAGARLQVAYDKMRQEVGKALQPIGAEFQAAFTEFIKDITPALVAVLPSIGQAALALATNIDTLVVAVVSFGSAFAAIKFAAIISSLGGIGSAAALAGKSLAAMNLAAMVNPAYLLAAGVAAIGVSLYNTWRQQEEFNRVLREAPLDEVNRKIDELRQSINDLDVKSRSAASGMSMFGGSVGFASAQAAQLKQDLRDLIARQQELALYEQAGVRVRPGFYGPGFAAPPEQKPLTDFKPPSLQDADKGGAKAARDAERIAQQLAQIKLQGDAIERSKALLEVNTEIRENARQIIFAQTENNTQKAYALRQDAISLEFLKKDLEIQLDYQKAVEAAALEENAQIRAAQLQLAEKQRIFGIEENINNAINDRIGLVQENTIELKKQAEALEDARFGLREQFGLVSPEEKVARAQEEFKQKYPGATAEDLDLIRQQIDPTPFESMRQNITQLKEELKELVDPINQITGAASAIGDAFSQSFINAITGATTAKQALADFFKSVGSYFLDMAKQIIAKMIQIAILNTVVKLFPGMAGGFGSTGYYNPMTGLGTAGPNFGLADGGTVMPGGTYLVGERGPEILQLNPNGSGQVINNNQLSSAMNRYRRSGSGATTATDGTTEASSGGVAVADKPIDVRYTVERINNVDYVTAEQFQVGMREAAKQGAIQGERSTLRRLQQSPATRRRTGLS